MGGSSGDPSSRAHSLAHDYGDSHGGAPSGPHDDPPSPGLSGGSTYFLLWRSGRPLGTSYHVSRVILVADRVSTKQC